MLTALLGALVPAAADAATYTVTPIADATVSSSKPYRNYGTASTLTQLAGSTTNRAYLRFVVPVLDGPITSASLRLFPTSRADLSVRPVSNTSWSETAITYANSPATGAAVVHSGSVPSGTYVPLDVTSTVAGSGPVGFALTTGQTWTMSVAARQTSTPPKLVVTTSTSVTTPPPPPAPTAPANSSAPTISGTPTSGQTLQATSGSWSGSTPMTYGYQWRRCDSSGINCVAVSGATSSSYALTSADVGSTLRARVTASNAAGSSSADSAATGSVAAPSSTPTNSFYVSTTGSDAAAGTQAAPWRTVARAATMAGPGSTVTIMAGSYAEDVSLTNSGQAGSPITFQSAPGATVTVRSVAIKASHVALAGLTISGATGHCVTVGAGALTNIAIDRSTITRCGRTGIHFTRPATPYTSSSYTNDVRITNNTISTVGLTDNYGNGATIYGNNVLLEANDITAMANDAVELWGDRITLRRNTVHDSTAASTAQHNDFFQTWTGLNDGMEGVAVTNLLIEQNVVRNINGPDAHCGIGEGPGHHTWTIRNNLFMNIGDQCLFLGKDGNGTQGITNVLIYNNTFVNAGANNTIEFNLATSAKLVNNIFYNCRGWGGGVPYYKSSAATLTADYNLAGGTTKILTEAHAKYGDPKFVNPASDFRLQSTSPAINAGDNATILGIQRTLDLNGAPTQGVADIGASEYQG